MSKMPKNKRTIRAGFTLTELAIVLGVVGMVLSAIWGAAGKVSINRKINALTTEILNVVEGIRALYPNGQFPVGNVGLSPYLIASGNTFPADLVKTCSGRWNGWLAYNGNCAFTPWGTQLIAGTQTGWDGFTASTSRFEIIIDEAATPLPCAAILSSVVGAGLNDGLVAYYDGRALNNAPTSANAAPAVFTSCNSTYELGFQFAL